MGKQPGRRIEFNNKYEYAIFDDSGCALDPTVFYPTREAAESSLTFFLNNSKPDPKRTYTILVRRTPKEWKILPPDPEGFALSTD